MRSSHKPTNRLRLKDAKFLFFLNVWLSLFASLSCSQSLACPAKCSCLGTLVDCSKQALDEVPKDLPSWTEVL